MTKSVLPSEQGLKLVSRGVVDFGDVTKSVLPPEQGLKRQSKRFNVT